MWMWTCVCEVSWRIQRVEMRGTSMWRRLFAVEFDIKLSFVEISD